MAVTIKKKALTITSLLTRLFDADSLAGNPCLQKAQELEVSGHLLKITPTTFGIVTPEANLISQVPMKMDTVSLAMKNKLGHTVKAILKDKVVDLITVAYQKYMDVEYPSIQAPLQEDVYKATKAKYYANGGINKGAAIKEYRELTGASLKVSKDQIEDWFESPENKVAAGVGVESTVPDTKAPEVNMEEIKLQSMTTYPVELDLKATPVPLKEAQKLNQPVLGTSSGSIYHVIAIGQSCVVAARIKKNNEIAIRAEVRVHANSTEGQKARSGLKFAGLKQNPAGHFSLHLEPEDFAMVKRSIGSTLFAMSIPFWGTCTDLGILQGAGK